MSLRRRLTGDAVSVHDRWRHEQGLAPLSAIAKLRLRFAAVFRSHPLVAMTNGELCHPFYVRADSSDEYVFQQVFRDREYDIDFPTPQAIVDAGANIGLAAILFASRFPAASIVAIEPDAGNFRVLQRNASPYPNIRCVQAGVWHRDAVLERVPDDAKPWAYRFQETESSEIGSSEIGSSEIGSSEIGRPVGIPSISLDQVAEMFPSRRIDLAKIDIEGAEAEVMRSDADWLQSVTTILIETHDRIVSGCEAAVASSLPASQFSRSTQGENHIFIRQGKLEARSNDP